ncbi:YqjK family protein [Erwinia sp. S38]|uniref:YqjK family protein n=1 Tax=Erwinia sp. S38 TaxID=2769338 RepID=UPI00190988DC|nr:YqjK family protein [Erwinia sp. S38]MBK0004857.1 YqjK-like family protein [Erwinia sp. S38]
MNSRHERQQRKILLLHKIRSQRAEIRRLGEELDRRMQSVDVIWGMLYQFRAPVMLCSGLLLMRGLRRKPGRLLLYIRRAAGVLGTVRFIRRQFTSGKRVR